MGRIIVGTILVLWGLSALFGFSLFRFFFAVIIILLGVHFLTGRRPWRQSNDEPTATSDGFLNEIAILSPVRKVVKTDDFKGGRVIMIFAGGEIDLREVKTQEKEISLEVTAVFGGAKVMVPKGWRVSRHGTAVIGGYDNRTALTDSATTLIIRGSVVFGGVEITN